MELRIPAPSPAAQHSCQQLCRLISDEVSDNGNWIPFSRFVELAFYTPDFGYYTGGSHKIGTGGDSTTAPVLSPLFGKILFAQLSVLLSQTADNIYEFGAGTRDLAVSLLQNFSDGLSHYYIVELSPELAGRQRAMVSNSLPPGTIRKIIHLDTLPDKSDGIVTGNEVLNAMPVEPVRKEGGNFQQIGVNIKNGEFVQVSKALATPTLLRSARNYFPDVEPYTSELHPAQHTFMHTVASKFRRGDMIFIGYGFDATQYYHPQHRMGTLVGHYRHHTVHDPFFLSDLTDLAARVNSTDIAQAATDVGLDLIDYTTQANFLLNLGTTDLLAQTGRPDTAAYLTAAAIVQQLVNPREVGELFKVIAFGKNIDTNWQGFAFGDICYTS